MEVRKSHERGRSELEWLSSRFSFSFAEYFDKKHMGFGSLRVINDDTILPNSGFGMHPHKDMEIVTIVLDGILRHSDSMGFIEDIKVGDIQYMSAGTGIKHSEMNPSLDETTKLLQIWIRPDKFAYEPKYERKRFEQKVYSGKFFTLVSGFQEDEGIKIRQKASISRGLFDDGVTIKPKHKEDGMGWYLFVIDGAVTVGENCLQSRDAIKLEASEELIISTDSRCDLLLFDINLTKEV